MNWYAVYIHGPAVIDEVFYPPTVRLVDGVRAKNDNVAGILARMRNPFEACDYMTVKQTSAAIGEGARRCREDDERRFLRQAKTTIY